MKAEFTGKTREITRKPIESFTNRIIRGDALKVQKKFPDRSIDCVVTSPPYWSLRDYEMEGQIGLERNFTEYLEKLLAVFDEVKRVLKSSGTCWVVIGDTYGGSYAHNEGKISESKRANKFNRWSANRLHSKGRYSKCLLQIPARFAIGMTERGWILRNEIIWHKPNSLPQSVKDRFTVDFEKVFFFVKERRYFFRQQFEPLEDEERLKRRFLNPERAHKWQNTDKKLSVNLSAIERSRSKVLREGRNKRCVWRIGTINFSGEHFAVFPPRLIEMPILAGCPEGGIVLDPFIGSGTTALVAKRLGRRFIGIELNPKYVHLAKDRIKNLN